MTQAQTPEALSKLRHLYQNMVHGRVTDSAQARRLADGLLSPAIVQLEHQHSRNAQLEAELLSKSKQLNASGLLITGLEGRLASLQQQAAAAKEAVATLQSERDANAILTAELVKEAARTAAEKLRADQMTQP